MHDTTRRATPSRCQRCGQCCRVISLDFTKAEITSLARGEAAYLAKHPESPHRAEIERLVRDARFIREHFHRVSRAIAMRRQPAFHGAGFEGRSFYVCDELTRAGTCDAHAARPFVCEGYPWYGSAPKKSLLVLTPCGYEADLITPEGRPST
jgi:Fe-S-cluster containining protein